MIEIVHDTIRLERDLPHPPQAVFDAYADLDQRTSWSVPSDDEVIIYESADFAIGGTDRFMCGARENLLAVSLVTWHATATPSGCLLVVTDQVTSTAGQGPIDGSREGYAAI